MLGGEAVSAGWVGGWAQRAECWEGLGIATSGSLAHPPLGISQFDQHVLPPEPALGVEGCGAHLLGLLGSLWWQGSAILSPGDCQCQKGSWCVLLALLWLGIRRQFKLNCRGETPSHPTKDKTRMGYRKLEQPANDVFFCPRTEGKEIFRKIPMQSGQGGESFCGGP